MAGVALATFAFGNVSAVIPRGYLSDRVGRRALVIVGLSVSGFATALAWLSAPETRVPACRADTCACAWAGCRRRGSLTCGFEPSMQVV
jgi:MFS family permease